MEKLLAGDDQIPVGLSNIAFNSWEQQRQQAFRGVVEMMRKADFNVSLQWRYRRGVLIW
jgi:hypothetical protein